MNLLRWKTRINLIHYKIQLFLFKYFNKYYKFDCEHIKDNHYNGYPEQCCYEQWCLQGYMCNSLKFKWRFNHKNNA